MPFSIKSSNRFVNPKKSTVTPSVKNAESYYEKYNIEQSDKKELEATSGPSRPTTKKHASGKNKGSSGGLSIKSSVMAMEDYY